MRCVSFGYGPLAEPVVRVLDLGIPDGDHLVIVGPSGVGKSTLASLIAGLLTPTTGVICLGGTPLCGLPPASLPAHRVLIPQEAYVFAGTLAGYHTYLAPAAEAGSCEAAD